MSLQRRAAIITFKAIHQFGGVLLGEHLGQLFTIAWTVINLFLFGEVQGCCQIDYLAKILSVHSFIY